MSARLCIALVVALPLSACLEPGRQTLGNLDNEPPTVVSTSPALALDGGITSVPVLTQIVITFSEAMDIYSLRPGITVVRGAEPVEVNVEYLQEPVVQNFGSTPFGVRVTPVSPLAPSTTYTLVLSTLLNDLQGVSFAAEQRIAFRIGP
jgi:hypothetical protein